MIFKEILNHRTHCNNYGDGYGYGNGFDGNGGCDDIAGNGLGRGHPHGKGAGEDNDHGNGNGGGEGVGSLDRPAPPILLCVDPTDLRCRVLNAVIHPIFEEHEWPSKTF